MRLDLGGHMAISCMLFQLEIVSLYDDDGGLIRLQHSSDVLAVLVCVSTGWYMYIIDIF
jgi:hypothetical protein